MPPPAYNGRVDGWATHDLGGRAAGVFLPPGRARGAVLFLADLAGRRPPLDRHLAAHRLACVAPSGADSCWAGPAEERFLLDEALPLARSLGPAVAAAGVGVGGQAALRLAFRHPAAVPVVGAVRPAVDWHDLYGRGTALDGVYESRERCRQDSAVLAVTQARPPAHVWFACPPGDAWRRGCDRLREKLLAVGVPHAADLATRGAAPPAAYDELLAGELVAALAAGLAKVARSLL